MTRTLLRCAMLLGAVLVVQNLSPAAAQAQNCGPNCQARYAGPQPDLFYNYFTPGTCAQATAAMYPSPIPTPPLVGHTYITYQPLMPHEFLYHHQRSYHRTYDNGKGLNATRITWH